MKLSKKENIRKEGENNNEVRNVVLDIAKGILILLMVVGHSGAPSWLVNCIYSFHMPCFFIISGILFSYSYLGKPKKFIKKRIKSIWWPFVKWTLIFLFLHNFFYGVGFYNDTYSLREMLQKSVKTFLLVDMEQLLGGFWFLPSLLFASILCLLYYKIVGIGRRQLVAGIIGLVAVSELMNYYDIHFYHLQYRNFLASAYFMSGTLLQTIKIEEIRKKGFIVTTALIFMSVSWFGGKVEMVSLNYINLVPYFVKSIIISWGFIIVLEGIKYKNWARYLTYIGVKTMDLLIFHFLAFKIISFLKIKIYGMDMSNLSKFPVIEENNSVFWIVYVILGVIICLSYSRIKDYIQNWYYIWRNQRDKALMI